MNNISISILRIKEIQRMIDDERDEIEKQRRIMTRRKDPYPSDNNNIIIPSAL